MEAEHEAGHDQEDGKVVESLACPSRRKKRAAEANTAPIERTTYSSSPGPTARAAASRSVAPAFWNAQLSTAAATVCWPVSFCLRDH